MSGPVIACLDEGRAGAAAAGVAGSLSRRLCSPLVLATVTAARAPRVGRQLDPSPVERARSVLLSQGASILADAADGAGPDPELRVELGEPAERLASLAPPDWRAPSRPRCPDRCVRSWARRLGMRISRSRARRLARWWSSRRRWSAPAGPAGRSCAVSMGPTSRWPRHASRSTSDGGSTRPSSSSTSLSAPEALREPADQRRLRGASRRKPRRGDAGAPACGEPPARRRSTCVWSSAARPSAWPTSRRARGAHDRERFPGTWINSIKAAGFGVF